MPPSGANDFFVPLPTRQDPAMFSTTDPARSAAACRAVITPTRSATLGAFLARMVDRIVEGVAAWRRRRHDARYLGYLDAATLNDMQLSHAALRDLGVDPLSSRSGDRQRFPF
jgi:hypothetical protein